MAYNEQFVKDQLRKWADFCTEKKVIPIALIVADEEGSPNAISAIDIKKLFIILNVLANCEPSGIEKIDFKN